MPEKTFEIRVTATVQAEDMEEAFSEATLALLRVAEGVSFDKAIDDGAAKANEGDGWSSRIEEKP